MYVVVSYDIPDDRRRTRVCNTLKNYGAHVQYSVFECQLKPKDFKRLKEALKRLIKSEEDNVRFYFLCRECLGKVEVIGELRLPPWQDYYVV